MTKLLVLSTTNCKVKKGEQTGKSGFSHCSLLVSSGTSEENLCDKSGAFKFLISLFILMTIRLIQASLLEKFAVSHY